MDSTKIEQLWSVARDDAGDAIKDVGFLVVGGPDDEASDGPPSAFSPKGETLLGTDSSRTEVAIQAAAVRDHDEPEVLALLRWPAEFARLAADAPEIYGFASVVSSALSRSYSTAGAGGALLWHLEPWIRSAGSASANLVNKRYGAQVGKFKSDLGPLLRDPTRHLSNEDLLRHTVVFAALWPAAVADELGTAPKDVARRLDIVRRGAGAWWTTLRTDAAMRGLATAIDIFVPTETEIAEYPEAPARAWEPLGTVVDRAVSRGLALLA